MSQGQDTLSEHLDEIYMEETACEPCVESSEQLESYLLSSDALVPQPGADIEIDLVLEPAEEINDRNIKSRSKIPLKSNVKPNTEHSNCNKKIKTDQFVNSDDFEYIRMEVIIPDKKLSEIINENLEILEETSNLGVIGRETVTERDTTNDSAYDFETNSHFSAPELTENEIKIELIASSEKRRNTINSERPVIKHGSSTHAEVKHSKKIANRPIYTCNDCNKTFYSPTALTKHSRLHAVTITQKLYLCEECGNIFLGLTALRIHTRTHKTDENSTYFDRGKKNTSNDLLLLRSPSNDSVRNVDDKLFTCLECDEAYGDVSALIKHNKRHAAQKPFCCETCGKLFRLRHSLTSHMLCHTGNKTYVCNECNKAFSKSDTWVRHRETCGIIFGCKECGLTFAARHHLNLHSRVHSGVGRIIVD